MHDCGSSEKELGNVRECMCVCEAVRRYNMHTPGRILETA
jgi:hypothetical protein